MQVYQLLLRRIRPITGRGLPPSSFRALPGEGTRAARLSPHFTARSIIATCLFDRELLKRILFKAAKAPYAVHRSRIRTTPLCKREFLRTRSTHHASESVVSFDAARLVIDSVLLVVLFRELLFRRPGPRPHGRIFDDHDVFE